MSGVRKALEAALKDDEVWAALCAWSRAGCYPETKTTFDAIAPALENAFTRQRLILMGYDLAAPEAAAREGA